MKNYKKYLLLISLMFIPTLVFASGNDESFPLPIALFMEAFVSIHMSVFVLNPLSKIISENNYKKVFWKLFVGRVLILLFFDFFVTTSIAMFDFLAVFLGAFILLPISALKQNNQRNSVNIPSNIANTTTSSEEIVIKCAKCGGVMQVNDKNCQNCGAPFEGNNVSVSTEPKVLVNLSNFDPIFKKDEDQLLEEVIKKELAKHGGSNNKLIPADILKRKNILNIIFSILVFVYISLIFFHFPIFTYILGIIILFIFFKLTRKYDLLKFLKKEIKARPKEKISNIVLSIMNSSTPDNFKKIRLSILLFAVVLPLIIFIKPRILYEKADNGYAVRYYAFGLTNFKTATIPETHRGEKVVSLRGNAFSNMPFLESVSLPNTITEIRGQAFKNDANLKEVNLPSKLEYLGGGAFYGCSSLKSIELPDTLTYMGGETFYKASSLEYVKLSKNLSEIRGDSFEYCTSLKSITIPDNVTRIGGHAFYGDTSLSEVIFTPNSKLNEIGSSAFRRCYSLSSITLPKNVYVNERAFKESPTTINYFDTYSCRGGFCE